MERAKGTECESKKSSNFIPGIVFIKYSDMLLPAKPASSFVNGFSAGIGAETVEGEFEQGGIESSEESRRWGFFFDE